MIVFFLNVCLISGVLDVELNGTARKSEADWIYEFTSLPLVQWFVFNSWFKYVFPCYLILSETLSRMWGKRRLCGAAGRSWTGPFQDDDVSWSLLSFSWPWWDVSVITTDVPINIASLSKTPHMFYTWEGNFHQKKHPFNFAHWASMRILRVQYQERITKISDIGRETCEITRMRV